MLILTKKRKRKTSFTDDEKKSQLFWSGIERGRGSDVGFEAQESVQVTTFSVVVHLKFFRGHVFMLGQCVSRAHRLVLSHCVVPNDIFIAPHYKTWPLRKYHQTHWKLSEWLLSIYSLDSLCICIYSLHNVTVHVFAYLKSLCWNIIHISI